jgi:hypothetical protein
MENNKQFFLSPDLLLSVPPLAFLLVFLVNYVNDGQREFILYNDVDPSEFAILDLYQTLFDLQDAGLIEVETRVRLTDNLIRMIRDSEGKEFSSDKNIYEGYQKAVGEDCKVVSLFEAKKSREV